MSDFLQWWQQAVFYHIYLRSFADSDGDGLGDLEGLIRHLDYLNGCADSLGIDAIWLSPCYPSPDKDFGYDVADYCAIDPRYGTLQQFSQLIKEAHQRGIRIMMDLVFNHTSDEHPWFIHSRASRENEKSDWYIWRDPKPDGSVPNNWQSVFGGKAWTWVEERQQYYLHLFLPGQPDLNWRNPKVREAIWENVRFWLGLGVDGFRLDVFNLWFKDEQLKDNPPRLGIRSYDRQRHLYDMDQPEMHQALEQFRGILDDAQGRTSIGELMGQDPERAASYCNRDQLHMIFNFEFLHSPWKPAAFQKAVLHWQDAMQDDGWPAYVLSNHDVSRSISRYGRRDPDPIAKLAAALLLTLRGTPFIYYGEEIGMPDIRLRRSQIMDPPGRKYWPIYKGRDVNRAPMQWTSGKNAGFSDASPWLPVHPGYRSRNVKAQRQDPESTFHFYRRLLQIRRGTPALHAGSFHPLQEHPRRGLAYLRHHEQADALIGLNFSPQPARLPFDRPLENPNWSLLLSSLNDSAAHVHAKSLQLGPYEAAIWLASD